MTIAILSNDHAWTYNLRKEIIQALIDKGHRVVLVLSYGKQIDKLIEMGCEFIDIPFERHGTNPLHEIQLIHNYRKVLKRLKPDVVLTYTIKPNIYGGMVCASLNIPYIANITGLGTAVENPGFLQKLSVFLYRIAFRKIKRVFFQNTENMQFFADKKLALHKHSLLPGSGVNLQRFSLSEYPSADTIEFAFISRIMKEKGIDQYLEAAENIKQKYPDTRFHICGFCEQAYEERIKDLQDRGIVEYHGIVTDIKDVLKKIHCLVHPTYYPEGMSNVLLEASACGRPIITTNRSGCREVIDDGINGFIVNQKDGRDLTEKIEKFIQLSYDEKNEMGINGRRKVEKCFDRQIVVDAYLKEMGD